MYGWKRKILHIDLTTKEYNIETPSIDLYEKFIGGKGLAGYYLKPFITKSWDSPEMPLLFFTGPLGDTLSPASDNVTVMSRSPLTGTIGDASAGGKLGNQIKRAGYDGIVITGKSNRLCGINITNGSVEISDARHMEQLGVSESNLILGSSGSNAAIGPAAENGVLFSSIIIDGNFAAGRNGLGLVMAEKKLKYIKVMGSEKTEVYCIKELKKAQEEIFRLTSASPVLTGELGISNYGTGAFYDLINSRRMMPTNNFRATSFSNAKNMNSWHYKKQYGYRKTGCPGCHILCKKIGKKGEAIPEFEAMSHFSALLENSDIQTVTEANKLCNNFGMDPISAAATLACYSEVTHKKLSSENILKLLTDIALNRGTGAELKLGSFRYAQKKSWSGSSMTVKKQELPSYDPRGAYGLALAYATSTRGACHLNAYPISHEILRKPVVTDRFTFSGKARIIKISEDIFSVVDSLITCKFIFFAASLEEYAKAFYGVTGIKTTAQDLMRCGERIYYNEKIMNSMNGFNSEDDDLPERFFTEPGTNGDEIIINPIDRDDFLKARSNYYKVRGLTKNGLPTNKKIKELGLDT